MQGCVDLIDVGLGVVGPVRVLAHVEHEVGVELVVTDGVDDRAVCPGALRRLAGDQRTDFDVGFECLVDGFDALVE